MTTVEFAYWLQGFFELANPGGGLTDQQVQCIRRHLALVFKHEIDPSYGPPEKQAELNSIHNQSHVNEVFDSQGHPLPNVLIRC